MCPEAAGLAAAGGGNGLGEESVCSAFCQAGAVCV